MPMSPAEKAIFINAASVRDNEPEAWFPLVMLCADPTFDTISKDARDLLVRRNLIQLTNVSPGYVVHDMVRDVILRME